RERHESRMKRQAEFAERLHDAEKILARVSLVEELQHRIIQRFDRTDHKKTARIAKRGQVLLIFEQVLYRDGHVVCHGRKFPMKYLRQFHRVTNAVKEIRIAEGDVLRPRGHLAPNVFEHHVAVDDSKHSLVNRYDWAMPAKMLASAARFRGTNDPVPVPGNDE